MALYFTHGHATGVEGQYLAVEPYPASLVLGDKLWLEACPEPVEGLSCRSRGIFYRQFAEFTIERLAAGAVAAGAVAGIARRVDMHSCLSCPRCADTYVGRSSPAMGLSLLRSYSALSKLGSLLPNNRLHKNPYTLSQPY